MQHFSRFFVVQTPQGYSVSFWHSSISVKSFWTSQFASSAASSPTCPHFCLQRRLYWNWWSLGFGRFGKKGRAYSSLRLNGRSAIISRNIARHKSSRRVFEFKIQFLWWFMACNLGNIKWSAFIPTKKLWWLRGLHNLECFFGFTRYFETEPNF